MLRLTEIKLPLDHAPAALRAAAAQRLAVAEEDIVDLRIFRRGHDARHAPEIRFIYTLDVQLRAGIAPMPAAHVGPTPPSDYRLPFVSRAEHHRRPVVIGAGPCGLFATLILAQMGLRPLLLERGKPVRPRTADTWGLWRRGVLQAQSNVQFGEGGAGTFSDGKLYSSVKDQAHRWRKVLTELVAAGAPEEILYVSKPHIGTFRLVTVVESLRATIEALGGTYRFQSQVTDLMLGQDRQVRGVVLADGEIIQADRLILAPGHSARDSFAMLASHHVRMHAKPFSIGARIEHPQSHIDRGRFGGPRPDILGAADYKMVAHDAAGRDVYSFCMCPGGTVVAATSEAGHLVTNGMSQYSRAERNANAALVVAITPERDYPADPLAGIDLQRRLERAAFRLGGGTYAAPAQRLEDFLAGRPSQRMGDVTPSYRPGVTPADLRHCLPDFAVAALRAAIPRFAAQLPGFDLADAVLTGVETRTSSPVRLDRDRHTLQSPNTPGLFPAGEGCGYAGGILSAAIDGIRAAEALAASLTPTTLSASAAPGRRQTHGPMKSGS